MPTSILELNERVKAAQGTLTFIIPQSGFCFQSIMCMNLFSSLRKPANCLSLFSDFLGTEPREWFSGPWPGGSERQRDRSASGLSRAGTPAFLARHLRASQGQVLAMSTPRVSVVHGVLFCDPSHVLHQEGMHLGHRTCKSTRAQAWCRSKNVIPA